MLSWGCVVEHAGMRVLLSGGGGLGNWATPIVVCGVPHNGDLECDSMRWLTWLWRVIQVAGAAFSAVMWFVFCIWLWRVFVAWAGGQ